MAQKKYLDQNGLSYLWGKIKGYVNDRFVRKSLDEKTYTGIIGTADTAADASFYFCNVMPDDYYTQWRVRVRIHASVPGQTAYEQRTDITIEGYRSTLAAYSAENANTGTRSYYYINLYNATKAGIENSIGHIIGVGLRYSTNPINNAYARTFRIELLDETNCSVELWDEMKKYSAVSGTGGTNFSALFELNASTNGSIHTGDANNYDRLLVYGANFTAGSGGIMAYSLFMEDEDGTYQSVVTTSGTGTAKVKNTCGFRPGKLWYMNKSSNTAAGANATPAHKATPLDSRYSLNAGNTLTNHKALYLVFTELDGLLYLADPWWAQDLPSKDDGYVYLYAGMIYANGYSLFLEANNPMYRYIDGRVVEYIPGQEIGVIGQAHGRVASFSDGVEGKPLKALAVGIEPVQAGSGDPSPDNVRPITGWTGAKVTRCRKNLLKPGSTNFPIKGTYRIQEGVVPKGQAAIMSFRDKDTSVDISDIYIGFVSDDYTTGILTTFRWVISNGRIASNASNAAAWGDIGRLLTDVVVYPKTGDAVNRLFARYDIQIELGSTATDYEPYQGETYGITFPTEAGTVYGGTLDVTQGLLTVTHVLYEFTADMVTRVVSEASDWIKRIYLNTAVYDGTYVYQAGICDKYTVVASYRDVSATPNSIGINYSGGDQILINDSNIATVEDAKSVMPIHVCYPLKSPVTYQLTPQQITTLLGANMVWADTGDILELQYVRGSAGDIEYIVSQSDAGTVNGHTVQSDVPANAAFTDTTYTLSQDSEDGHKITLTPSAGNPATITIPDNDTTYSPATSSANGLMSAADKEKLDSMSSTRVYDDTLEYKTQSGWSPVDITLQPFTAAAEASVEWELGAIASSSGANSDSSTRLRTVSYLPSGIVSITPASGYRFVLVAYDDGTYIGAWNGTSYAKTATWLTNKVEASDLGQHDFRIVFARNPDSGTMTMDEKSNIVITQNVRMTVNDLARRMTSLEKALMGIDLSDPESAIYALALRVAQLEAHAILDSGYPSESSS